MGMAFVSLVCSKKFWSWMPPASLRCSPHFCPRPLSSHCGGKHKNERKIRSEAACASNRAARALESQLPAKPYTLRNMLDLHSQVQYVKGVGPRLAEVLAAKGITTVEDLLYYLPFRYEDRQNPRGISELRPGETAAVIAEVRTSGLFRTRKMPLFEMTAGQGRATLKCLWFHGAYLKDKF